MELYLKLIDVIFPVFALVGVGYYLGKKILIMTQRLLLILHLNLDLLP